MTTGEWEHRAEPRWLLHGDVGLDGSYEDDVPLAMCAQIDGLFADLPPRPLERFTPPMPRVRLLGCRPEPPLLAALDLVGRSSKAALRRRRIRADVYVVAADGTENAVVGAVVCGTVAAAAPSRLGAGLLDVTVDSDPWEPLPTGVERILELWRAGRPAEKNLWAGDGRDLRHHWAGVALGYRSGAPDRPEGATYDLDGRFVTDVEGFYCAIGEAINGPGGYFGWNFDALNDCLRGGFGARTPFRLVWHDSAVAREHLVAGYDRYRRGPSVTLEDLLDRLAAYQVEIELC